MGERVRLPLMLVLNAVLRITLAKCVTLCSWVRFKSDITAPNICLPSTTLRPTVPYEAGYLLGSTRTSAGGFINNLRPSVRCQCLGAQLHIFARHMYGCCEKNIGF